MFKSDFLLRLASVGSKVDFNADPDMADRLIDAIVDYLTVNETVRFTAPKIETFVRVPTPRIDKDGNPVDPNATDEDGKPLGRPLPPTDHNPAHGIKGATAENIRAFLKSARSAEGALLFPTTTTSTQGAGAGWFTIDATALESYHTARMVALAHAAETPAEETPAPVKPRNGKK